MATLEGGATGPSEDWARHDGAVTSAATETMQKRVMAMRVGCALIVSASAPAFECELDKLLRTTIAAGKPQCT
jgi:hypothetical protein